MTRTLLTALFLTLFSQMARGASKTMTEIINDIVAQIDQIIFWLRVTVYLVLIICIVWLIGFVRRNLGLDAHSIELRRIRRILEGQSSGK